MGARESLIPAQACVLGSEEEQDRSSGTWAGVLAPLLPHFAAVGFSFLFQEMATVLHALPSKTGGVIMARKLYRSRSLQAEPLALICTHGWLRPAEGSGITLVRSTAQKGRCVITLGGAKEGPAHLPLDQN